MICGRPLFEFNLHGQNVAMASFTLSVWRGSSNGNTVHFSVALYHQVCCCCLKWYLDINPICKSDSTFQSVWVLPSAVLIGRLSQNFSHTDLCEPICPLCLPRVTQRCSDASSGLFTCMFLHPRAVSCWARKELPDFYVASVSGLWKNYFAWISVIYVVSESTIPKTLTHTPPSFLLGSITFQLWLFWKHFF